MSSSPFALVYRRATSLLRRPQTLTLQLSRRIHSNLRHHRFRLNAGVTLAASTAFMCCVTYYNFFTAEKVTSTSVNAEEEEEKKDGESKKIRSNKTGVEKPGENRFRQFASMEMKDTRQPLMTFNDLLDSLILDRPKPRIKTKLITEGALKVMLAGTPRITTPRSREWKEDPNFIRSLKETGILTFNEYMFLLSILTRPQSGFRAAFDVIDASRENTILKSEYNQVSTF